MWTYPDRRLLTLTHVAGICGILIPVVIFTCLGLSLASSPWFTWTEHALSDLGIQETTAAVFNNGLILGGILTLLFSLGLMKMLSKKIGAYILALSSLALIGVGLFPETIFTIHFFSSASFFVLLTVALLFIGLSMKKNPYERNMGVLACVCAFIAAISSFFLFHLEGIAIPEALSCFPAFIWFMIVGTKMVRV